ncbi:MAG: UDP-N-acetylmuramoyl-tripeptide--D-alanyl-D-alanine ligase [Patescibacteria group bacterium]
MSKLDQIITILKKCNYSVSTDTRGNIAETVFFAIPGETFDGSAFTINALEKGALAVVTQNPLYATTENVILVSDVVKTLQSVAQEYRKLFTIPLIAIGGSNGKTTSKELTRDVLKTKYNVHATHGSLNNHIGVPLSILSMPRDTEIAVFEIGANHPHEHLDLLQILQPTHVVVTNNGMDHLEGFGSPEGSRQANKEIYDWARGNKCEVFVDKNQTDLVEDSEGNVIHWYGSGSFEIVESLPLTITFENKIYKTHLAGDYNLININLAIVVGNYFTIDTNTGLTAICNYTPSSKRSEFVTKNNINYIVDCYNANPTSMMLSLESFISSAQHPCGVVLGDMLELGKYSEIEHKKIVDYIASQKLDSIIFIGKNFEVALQNTSFQHNWFPDSDSTKVWFDCQNFTGYTFLLKGSRGVKVEKILGM